MLLFRQTVTNMSYLQFNEMTLKTADFEFWFTTNTVVELKSLNTRISVFKI